MLSNADEDLGEGVLAIYNGMKFRLNDVVDVIVGTMVCVSVRHQTPPASGHG